MHAVQQATLALLASLAALSALVPQARANDRSPSQPAIAHGDPADGILGYWQRGEGEAVIEIQRESTGYSGVIVASERHPEAIGTEIFKSLSYDVADQLWRGRVYSIERDRDFKIQMELPAPDRFVIRLRILFFSRSVEFKRQPSLRVATGRMARD
jgi:uncharacterized protein (DUF2147 family)